MVFHGSRLVFFMVPGGFLYFFFGSRLVFMVFLWFQVGFFMVFMVPGWFFMVPGRFFMVFVVPGLFFMVFAVSGPTEHCIFFHFPLSVGPFVTGVTYQLSSII